MELSGKVALVTGAARRLGRAIALTLAAEGVDVVLHVHTSSGEDIAREIATLGRQAWIVRADLSRPAEAYRLSRGVEALAGRVDILVNSAAVFFPTPLPTLTVHTWQTVLHTNLTAPFVLSLLLGRAMRERGTGKIIQLGDWSGKRPLPGYLPYCVSKGGVLALTHVLAKALAPQVQVNAVDPNGQGGFSTMIQNAGQATINGFELEVIAKPINDIIINFGYGYTDASYDDYISVSPITGLPADVADDRGFEFTPDDNYNLSISYVLPLNLPTGDITARLDISGQDDIIFTPKISGNEDIAQDSYELINLRIAYEEVKAGDGTFTVALWGRNLADEEYKIGGFEIDAGDPAFGGLGRAAISQWGAPRTYGIDLIYAMGD